MELLARRLAWPLSSVALLASCVSPPGPAVPDEPSPTLSTRSTDPTEAMRAQWALPLDAYVQHDLSLASRALLDDYAGCLRAGGISAELEKVEIESLMDRPTAVTNIHGRRLFDESIARQHGYRYEALDHTFELGVPDDLPNEDESDIASQCSASNGSTFPPYPAEPLQFHLATAAYWGAKAEAGVVAAAALWRECLGAGEEIAIPGDPTQVPDEAVSDYLKIAEHDSVRTVSARERTFATKDAQCRQNSGYSDALYAAEYELSRRALDENRVELERELDAYEVFLAHARALVEAS